MELDDILKEEKAEVKDPVEKVIQEEERSQRKAWQEREATARAEGEKPRDPETGKFVKEETVEGSQKKDEEKTPEPEKKSDPKPEKPEFSERERAFLANAQEERRKRQELEARLEALEKQKDPPKPFFEDPDGALKQRDDEILKTRQETAQQLFQMKLQTSEEIARVRYQDYDQVVEIFKEIAAQAPALVQQCMASPNPADFAYKLGKHHKEMREFGSIEAYRLKVAQEERAKLEAEYKDKLEKELKARKELVPSLSDAHSTKSNKTVWGGPTPLDNILGS